MGSGEWKRVAVAADLVGKTARTIYRYLDKPQEDTGIRRRRIGTTIYVHIPSLQDYEATVTDGRPPKYR